MKKNIDISFTLPGSKSIGARAALLAALSESNSTLRNIPTCRDFSVILDSLATLGFKCERDLTSGTVTIKGENGKIPAEGGQIYVHENGTALRMLTAFCSLGRGEFILDGEPRLRERPVKPLADALNNLGADVACTGEGAPVTVRANGLPGGETVLDCSRSSQFLSALLVAGAFSHDGIAVKAQGLVSRPYVDITHHLMMRFGLKVEFLPGDVFKVPGRQKAKAVELAVESDTSSAAYFFAAAALCGGSARILNLPSGSLQADMMFVDVLRRMGADAQYGGDWVEVRGTGQLSGMEIDMGDFPDSVPLLAAVAPFCSTPTTIKNVPHLRLKESDRIAAIQQELERCGAKVESGPDWLKVYPSEIIGCVVDSHNDHRIAMSMSVLGLRSRGVEIDGAECVEKSFPEFFEYLEKL